MAYVDETTMAGSVPVPGGSVDTPGQPAGTKMFNDGIESFQALVANRPLRQLAENCDIIKALLEREVAEVEVVVVAGADSATVTLTPGGGAGHPSAGVYVGDSLYSAPDSCILLVSVLDESNNEVQDPSGDEIICTAVQRADTHADLVGQGTDFWDSTDVELIFSSPLVSGADYRITLGVESSLGGLRADALLHSKVRANQEVDADVQKQIDLNVTNIGTNATDIGTNATDIGTNATDIGTNAAAIGSLKTYVTCAASGDADYVGISAIEDAISGSPAGTRYYVRPGTYEVGSFTLNGFSPILGAGADQVTINPAGAHDINIGISSTVEGVTFAAISGHSLVMHQSSRLVNCVVDNFRVAPYVGEGDVHLINVVINRGMAVAGALLDITASSDGCVFDRVRISTIQLGTIGIRVRGTTTTRRANYFVSCNIIARDTGVLLDTTVGENPAVFESCTFTNTSTGSSCVLYEDGAFGSFHNCRFIGDESLVDGVSTGCLKFYNCVFKSSATSWYNIPFVRILGPSNLTKPERRCALVNCTFEDQYCQGNSSTTPPTSGGGGWASRYPVMDLVGVDGQGVVFDRGSITHIVQDSPWVRFSNCNIIGFSLVATTGADFKLYSDYSYGQLVEVLDYSKIADLTIRGDYAGSSWTQLVYIKGTGYSSSSEIDAIGVSEVNGLLMMNGSSADPSMLSNHCPIVLNGAAILRKLMWPLSNKFAAVSGVVQLGNEFISNFHRAGNTLENFYIYLDMSVHPTADPNCAIVVEESDGFLIDKGRIFAKTGDDRGTFQCIKCTGARGATRNVTAIMLALSANTQEDTAFIFHVTGTEHQITGCKCWIEDKSTGDTIYAPISSAIKSIVTGNILLSGNGVVPTIDVGSGVDSANLFTAGATIPTA